MSLLVIAAGWLTTGAIAVAVMHHRGHDTFAWAVLFLCMGPLAIPLAVSSHRHRPPDPDSPSHPGRLDVLVADDGSPQAAAALESALGLLGAQMTSVTVAAVVDLEATSTVRGRDTQREAQARLDAVVGDIAGVTEAPVDTVILFGEPTHALQRFAADHGYELIVVGCRSAARSHLVGRGDARKRATHAPVPVFVGPAFGARTARPRHMTAQ